MNHHSQNSTILIIQPVVMNTRRWAKKNGACSANVKHRDGRQNISYFYLRLTLSKGARRKTRVPRIVIFLIPIGNLPSRILMLRSRSKDAYATSLESAILKRLKKKTLLSDNRGLKASSTAYLSMTSCQTSMANTFSAAKLSRNLNNDLSEFSKQTA